MTADANSANVEVAIRAAWLAGNFPAAARVGFERYGREILSFIHARLRNEDDAEEAFSMFAEDLWSGIEAFEWRCSMRCWLYILARNAANRCARAPHRKLARNLPLSPYASLLAVRSTRAETPAHCDSELKQRVRALRERLPTEDQTLLVLHVDRRLSWRELALVMHEPSTLLEGEALEREAGRLRKRFERIKAELKRLAIADGLLPSASSS